VSAVPLAPRVKVCGLRTPEDLRAARGADAVGFVVASPGSRRELPAPEAAALAAQAPPFVETVLVTRETHPARLAALHGAVPTAAVQVHGVLDAAHAQAVRKAVHGKLLLALGVTGYADRTLDLARALARHADGIVLDTPRPDGTTGGAGAAHDWRVSARVAKALDVPVVLAGGLTAGNVAEAVRAVRPWAVDVSGGVEGPKGKSRAKVLAFLEAARHG
jgi:phosphoribosylanthranilate isomerase